MAAWMELIRGRKSVRTFDGRGLSEADRAELERFAAGIAAPFDATVRFVFLDADQYGLSSPVIAGEKLYVAGIVSKAPLAEAAYGYAFEELVLHAWSMGIGTTWIGGTMKRELFEKAAGLAEGELMPCVSPLGYPAAKRSLKETLMRKGVGADSRMPAENLFFDGTFDTPLAGAGREAIADLIEMVRFAPSAVNKQPWRILCRDGLYHFYEKKDKGYIGPATGDLQKIDVGIALCHFVKGAAERGADVKVCVQDPGVALPDNMEYIASVSL